MGCLQTSDGLRLAYDVDDFTDPWRPAETVVMLHSAMSSAHRMARMVPALARHWRVVRLDLRGHGRSQLPPGEPPLSMPRLVADVAELLNHLGLEAAHVVGNAMGGCVAQNFALAAPARARSLCLFGSPPGLVGSQARNWPPRMARQGLREFLAETIADRFDPARTDPGLIEWFLDECAKNDVAYIGRFIALMTTLDWSDQLDRITCPTLLVMPGAESIGRSITYERMRDTMPDARLLVYEGMPHNVCDADPDRCAADVAAFLRERFG
jgi:pimeloyl-ACP methyl ester carboxylesterase